jgi:hypothetical protein
VVHGIVVSGGRHGSCLACPACSLHGTGILSSSSLASCAAPLACVCDNEVVVSWQVGVASGSCVSVPVSVHMHAACYMVGMHPPCTWRGPGRAMFPSPPRPGHRWLGPGCIASSLGLHSVHSQLGDLSKQFVNGWMWW